MTTGIRATTPRTRSRTPDGSGIPIEERNEREVTHVGSTRMAPQGAAVWNPAFDVTPHRLIAGIVTDHGICRPPYTESLQVACQRQVAKKAG